MGKTMIVRQVFRAHTGAISLQNARFGGIRQWYCQPHHPAFAAAINERDPMHAPANRRLQNCPKIFPQNCVCLKDYIWPLVLMCLAKVLKRIKLIKKGAWALSTKTLAQSKKEDLSCLRRVKYQDETSRLNGRWEIHRFTLCSSFLLHKMEKHKNTDRAMLLRPHSRHYWSCVILHDIGTGTSVTNPHTVTSFHATAMITSPEDKLIVGGPPLICCYLWDHHSVKSLYAILWNQWASIKGGHPTLKI